MLGGLGSTPGAPRGFTVTMTIYSNKERASGRECVCVVDILTMFYVYRQFPDNIDQGFFIIASSD